MLLLNKAAMFYFRNVAETPFTRTVKFIWQFCDSTCNTGRCFRDSWNECIVKQCSSSGIFLSLKMPVSWRMVELIIICIMQFQNRSTELATCHLSKLSNYYFILRKRLMNIWAQDNMLINIRVWKQCTYLIYIVFVITVPIIDHYVHNHICFTGWVLLRQ